MGHHHTPIAHVVVAATAQRVLYSCPHRIVRLLPLQAGAACAVTFVSNSVGHCTSAMHTATVTAVPSSAASSLQPAVSSSKPIIVRGGCCDPIRALACSTFINVFARRCPPPPEHSAALQHGSVYYHASVTTARSSSPSSPPCSSQSPNASSLAASSSAVSLLHHNRHAHHACVRGRQQHHHRTHTRTRT